MLIDSHAHIFWPSFEADLDAVVKRAKKAGVGIIVNIGTNLDTSQEALEQANKVSNQDLQIYSTIGIHPHDYEQYIIGSSVSIQQDITKLKEIYHSQSGKIIAIGECGLDFYFEGNPDYNPSSISTDQIKNIQRQLFKAQIELARKLNLPVVVHCRNAWNEILDYLNGCQGVLHCYSGDLADTKKVLMTKLYISYAANITYPKNDTLRETIKLVPLDRILIETDAPFLAPQGKRGGRNEPANVLEVAKTIAKVKEATLNQIAHQTTNNSKALFNIVQ